MSERLTSGEGVIVSSTYDAYGGEHPSTTNTDPFAYNGRWGYFRDSETGLYLCQHRYYDPSAGRWLTRDPISYRGGIDIYGYCKGASITNIDYRGLQEDVEEEDNDLEETVGGFIDACREAWNGLRGLFNSGKDPAPDPGINTDPVTTTPKAPDNTGNPGSIQRGPWTSRRYGEDGYPETDRDWDTSGGHTMPDHSHDWYPSSGGFPTRGPERPPIEGDPPPPWNAPGEAPPGGVAHRNAEGAPDYQ